MKIRDIYQLPQGEVQEDYALDEWYNTLINKDITELDISDLCRMIKQRSIFIELAIDKAIGFLKLNPLEGDVYDGQLLEVLFSVDREKITEQKEPLKEVLIDVKEKVEMDDFMSDEDFNEYIDLVEQFLTKINSY
ncbi:contact-dependent growth inhibition system immunity protein [Lysinibacillus louembei]|uniref:Contact-dependent growth inhibition system immunity protein n=1 Tax=Lysinibacillus louembei TaxID=1470088 RepID=A0ABZ0RXU8_9BACI|nr:contact-dependent growth inhibition system immunity protein [Lysinibacillus louembei]WPK12106.1 contact-dependent growth inhibition system immunity protein [Lysinibacillus louembei]